MMPQPIAITPGEPAGIGPDIVLQLATQTLTHPIVAFADQTLLAERAHALGLDVKIKPYIKNEPLDNQTLYVKHIALDHAVTAGVLSTKHAAYVLETIKSAASGCMQKQFAALVTGPVHKASINEAGITFAGHTQMLAKLAGVDKTVMLFVCDAMKVALVTTHLPLQDVANQITAENLTECIRVIQQDLAHYFNIKNARLLVCGLNPHAGEQGHLGKQEQTIITPTLESLRQQGYNITGPVSADSAFTSHRLEHCDVVVAMYHDQALPVIKYASFGEAVNITLGLPFIRTSVDHGTALALAATGKANPRSLLCAYQCAINMINKTSQHAPST